LKWPSDVSIVDSFRSSPIDQKSFAVSASVTVTASLPTMIEYAADQP
jgi:hypothetical protein